MNRLLETIVERMERSPDQPFCRIIGGGHEEELNWGGLGALAGRFHELYQRRGIVRGDTVLIFLGHGTHVYGAFVGAMLCGAVPSMMPLLSSRQDPNLFWRSHAELLSRLRPVFVVAKAATFEEMRAAGLSIPDSHVVRTEDLPEAGSFMPVAQPESAIALLQHTSGTTGLKKGVALSFLAIINQLENYARTLQLADGDEIVSWLPLYHDMGLVACFLLPLYFGLPVRHIDPFHWIAKPSTLLVALHGRSGTLAWMPNFGFEHITRTVRDPARYDLTGVKALINCSEPCKPGTFDRFARAFAQSGLRPEQLRCCYAMAENTFAVTQTPLGRPSIRIRVDPNRLGMGERPITGDGTMEMMSVGPDIDGVETIVVNEARQPVADGVIGEIAIRGTSLFTGYNLDPDRTAERLTDGCYYSGDLGLRQDGQLFVLGRSDDLIIVNGRNLFAHEIEAALADVEGIKPGRVVVVARDNEQSGSSDLIVIAERSAPSNANDEQVRRDIMSIVYSIFGVSPKDIALRDAGWLVKTTSGKISRESNLVRYTSSQG
jgi:fatty-acyl-CoA synthase